MRIALATTSLSPNAGANTGMSMLGRQLRALGHEVSLWRLGRDSDYKIYVSRLSREIEREGRDRLEMGRDVFGWPEFWEHADVVHITNPGVINEKFARALDMDLGPLVLSVHDPHEFQALHEGLIWLMGAARKILFVGREFLERTREAGWLPQTEFDCKAVYTPQPYVRIGRDAGKIKARRIINTSPWRGNKNIPLTVEAASYLPEGLSIEFHTANRNPIIEEFAEQTGGWERCEDHDQPWQWPGDAERIYGTAAVLVDLVYFDGTDTGRTEYPILEAWDFGATPVVLKGFATHKVTSELHDQWGAAPANVHATSKDPIDIAATITNALEHPVPREWLDDALLPHEEAGRIFVEAYEDALNG